MLCGLKAGRVERGESETENGWYGKHRWDLRGLPRATQLWNSRAGVPAQCSLIPPPQKDLNRKWKPVEGETQFTFRAVLLNYKFLLFLRILWPICHRGPRFVEVGPESKVSSHITGTSPLQSFTANWKTRMDPKLAAHGRHCVWRVFLKTEFTGCQVINTRRFLKSIWISGFSLKKERKKSADLATRSQLSQMALMQSWVAVAPSLPQAHPLPVLS